MSETLDAPLATASWLRAQAGDPGLRIVDTRWVLGQPGRGRAAYEVGHIPGAIHLDVESELSDVGKGGPGRHPLPDPEALRELLSRAGVGDETCVVAYDDLGGMAAARLWWLLALHGHRRARVLDGGLAAWSAAGGELTTEVPGVAPAAFSLRAPLARVADREDTVAAIERGALLLDARAPERYEGRVEPIDRRPGHIPTARSAPFLLNLDDEKRFRSPADLRARYEALGATSERIRRGDVVTYCGSGVTACHDALGMVAAGLPMPVVYEGSWSDWIHDDTKPEALGSEPGEWSKRG